MLEKQKEGDSAEEDVGGEMLFEGLILLTLVTCRYALERRYPINLS